MIPAQTSKTINPPFTEKFFWTNPINKGIIAPPMIAMVISPEISLLLAGLLLMVKAKINGNRLADANPTNTIEDNVKNRLEN